MLFVVHREEILKKAKETFDKVLKGRNIKTGLFTGNKKEYDSDYLFATIQTMIDIMKNLIKSISIIL